MVEEIALGIDLGTTNSVAAYYVNGRAKVLENFEGGRLTPSFVFFSDNSLPVVGEHARKMSANRPEYGLYEIKRLIGRKYDDPVLQRSLKYFAFNLEKDANGEPVISFTQKETIKKTAVEVNTEILKKIKNDVERKLGVPADKAVITVPAYFNVNQREATLQAGKMAGFTVLKLLNEPTATALKYYYNKSPENVGDYVLVFDLGGGTFDVAILKWKKEGIDIVAVNGDTALGGHDIDNLLIEYVLDFLKREHNFSLPEKMSERKRLLRRLKNLCEDTKTYLSIINYETIDIDNTLVPNTNNNNDNCISIEFPREKLEEICKHLFEKMIEIVSTTLKDCKICKSDIKRVILAGGSTRIPKIQQMLSDFFDEKKLCKFENADECIAEGAALQAAIILKKPGNFSNIAIKDVIPLSLGSVGIVNQMHFQINRNTLIPCHHQNVQSNLYNNQRDMLFEVYEGERLNCKFNRLLGTFTLHNLTPCPPNECHVTLSFDVDINGILTVTAKEKYKDNEKQLNVDYCRSTRSDAEVKNALQDLEANKEEEERFAKYVENAVYLRKYCNAILYNLEDLKLLHKYQKISSLCSKIDANVKIMSLETVCKTIIELEEICKSIISKYNFKKIPFKK